MQTIVAIQALRAIAALAVAAVHFDSAWLTLTGRGDAPIPLYSLASGVDLFFVISGFVMVYSSEALYGRPDAPQQFMMRRLSRIVAPYWLATLLAIPVMGLSFTWSQLAASLLFIPYTDANGAFYPLLGVGWTLNFEMFFYVVFALALFGPRRSVVPFVWAALAIIVMAAQLGQWSAPAWRFLSDPIVLEFAVGMVVAVAYRRGVTLPASARALLIVFGASAIWFSREGIPPSHWRAISWGLPALLMLAGAVLGPPPAPGKLTRLTTMLGDASYSMYLLHALIVTAFMRLWPLSAADWLPLLAALAATYVATIALSVASFRLFERPTTALIQRLFKTPPVASPARP